MITVRVAEISNKQILDTLKNSEEKCKQKLVELNLLMLPMNVTNDLNIGNKATFRNV